MATTAKIAKDQKLDKLVKGQKPAKERKLGRELRAKTRSFLARARAARPWWRHAPHGAR